MQNGWSYIKDSGDFLKKIGNLGNIPETGIGLLPNIQHMAGLNTLNNMFETRKSFY